MLRGAFVAQVTVRDHPDDLRGVTGDISGQISPEQLTTEVLQWSSEHWGIDRGSLRLTLFSALDSDPEDTL